MVWTSSVFPNLVHRDPQTAHVFATGAQGDLKCERLWVHEYWVRKHWSSSFRILGVNWASAQ